jgi:hypothetical protein
MNASVRVLTRGSGGRDFSGMFIHRYEFTLNPGVETAPFGEDVVLDTEAGDASAFILGDGSYDVDGIAEAVVTIGDHRNADRFDHAANGVEGFTHGEDVGVGQCANGGDAKPASPDGVKPCFFREFRREGIVRAEY